MLTFKTIHDFTDDLDSFSTLSFRTIDGTANNLINPTFNTTGSDMIRIAVPKFAPGTKNTPIDGPSPREISNVVSSGLQAGTADTTGLSAMMYVCGQFIDHDLDHTLPDGTISTSPFHPAIPISQPAALFLCLDSSWIQPTEIR